MKFTVLMADPEESYTVAVDARDRRAFELNARRIFGGAAEGQLRSIANAMPENYSYWLAWHALSTRAGLALSWDEFDARAVGLDTDGEDESPDPTGRGRTPA